MAIITSEFFPLSYARRRGDAASKRAALPAMRALAIRGDACVDTREAHTHMLEVEGEHFMISDDGRSWDVFPCERLRRPRSGGEVIPFPAPRAAQRIAASR